MLSIQYVDLNKLKPNSRNARTHSKRQVSQIAESIKTFGFLVPIVVDQEHQIIAGHGRLRAAELLELAQVPVVVAAGLSEAKRRALALAENKIPENAGWDRDILAAELSALSEVLIEDNLEISVTGFSPVEVDQILIDLEENSADPDDHVDPRWMSEQPVTQRGDVWVLGRHRLLCGDARDAKAVGELMGGQQAAMVFTDPPYNVRVQDVVGRGTVHHDEFAMASGEMTTGEFRGFLEASLGVGASVSRSNAVHYVCMDWRHIEDLIGVGSRVYAEMLNLVVWVKTNIGQGSFYRSQHELIGVFRVGEAQHLDNIVRGKFGRTRSNVWRYEGVNTFRPDRMADLHAHPTVKPVAMVVDAMKDCSRRGDVVLDLFCGSGTTILAAERVGRCGFGIEIEPRFVDVAVRRWQAFTKMDAVHQSTGAVFNDGAALRHAVAA